MSPGDVPIAVWCGNYPFGDDDSFFPSVVTVARKYVDKEPERRPPEPRFREELEALSDIAPRESQGVLDQLEHRWRHPHSAASLYVLACTLRAPERGALVDDTGKFVQELLCTKVGQAKRTVAARLAAYKTQVLGGVRIAERSQSLRVVIYGDGSAMLLEREIQEVAKRIGSRAQAVDEGGARYVGDETYVGVEMIGAICAFARNERAFNLPKRASCAGLAGVGAVRPYR
jgi:hypothetical protein